MSRPGFDAGRDPRLVPARPDLAADHLVGVVAAERYVPGAPMRVEVDQTPLRHAPSPGAPLDSELLYGEDFIVYEIREGWAWGQAPRDLYVGYVAAVALAPPPPPRPDTAPTSRVSALRTFVYPGPDLKLPILGALSLNARVIPGQIRDRFVEIPGLGWIFADHLRPDGAVEPDWVAVAERFVGTPYLWGGRTPYGCDCSGLVQSALESSGVIVPRDSDLMEAHCPPAREPPARGDLVFWKGHVGIMIDGERLLHANAHHMAVAIEPLRETLARLEPKGVMITSRRRPPTA